MRIPAALAVLAALLSPPAQAGAEALTYEIRKEAEPIGRETVRIDRQGAVTRVEVETRTTARVLFMDFHYDHHRHEEWRDGKLVSMVADTNDDGTHTHAEVRAGGAGWTVVVNGQTGTRPGDSLPLTLWGQAILGRSQAFSIIDAKPYRVSVVSLGRETLSVGGKTITADHVRVSGDVERDLWYGPDGLLLRAAFQRAGYPIEIVRTDF